MQYLLLVCAEGPVDDDRVELEMEATIPAPRGEAAERHGILVVGSPQPAMAATLEFRGRDVTITDGPYARTYGQICGFDIIDGEQLEEVIELASRPSGP
jgi:hypothetical protein